MLSSERYYPKTADERNHILFMLKLGACLEWRHKDDKTGPWTLCNLDKEERYLHVVQQKGLIFESWNEVEYRHVVPK